MKRAPWLVILVVGAGVWANSLGNAFQYDDFHSIVNNIHLRQLSIGQYLQDPSTFSIDGEKGMYRPLLLTTFALNYSVGGMDVTGYHIVNVAIHLAAAVVVWWLTGLLGGGVFSRLAAGLLFAIHPVCSEPVNYISSRSESLSALFYLSGLALFLRAHTGTLAWRIGVWAAIGLGLLSKSTVATLPLALLLLDLFVIHHGKVPGSVWRRVATHHLPGWGVLGAWVLIVTGNGWLTRSLSQDVRGSTEQWLTQIKALLWYAQLLIVPTRLNVEPQFAVQTHVTPVVVVAALLLVTVIAAALWWLRRAWGRALFLLMLPVLHMAPTLVVPLNVLVNERRAYLAVAVACIGIVLFLGERRLLARRHALVPPLILFAVLSWQRSSVWASDATLWMSSVERAPRMSRSHLYLGNAYKDVAQHTRDRRRRQEIWRMASASYERAYAEARGRDADLARRALNNRGGVHYSLSKLTRGATAQQEFARAEALYREAVRADPTFSDALVNVGSCVLERARQTDGEQRIALLEESRQYFRAALQYRPNHPSAHANLGVVLEDLGQWGEAEQRYRHALALTPGNWTTLKNLALLLSRRADEDLAAGRRPQAEAKLREAHAHVSQALRLNPATGGAEGVLKRVTTQLRALQRP